MRTMIPIDKIDKSKFEAVRVCGEYVALLFSDGTACVVTEIGDGYVTDASSGYIGLWEKPLLGLMTQEEYLAEEEVRKARHYADTAARDRQEYERLKKLFEGE